MAWKSEGKGLNNDSGRVETCTRNKASPNRWEMKLTDAGVTAAASVAAAGVGRGRGRGRGVGVTLCGMKNRKKRKTERLEGQGGGHLV